MAELRERPLYSDRDDPAVPHFDDRGPIAIMDGDCVLCASGARAIAKFRRRKILDTSVHATLEDLAKSKSVAPLWDELFPAE